MIQDPSEGVSGAPAADDHRFRSSWRRVFLLTPPGAATLALFTLAGWWSRRRLDWPFSEIAVVLVCAAAYALGAWSMQSARGARGTRVVAGLTIAAFALLVYGYTWNRYTEIFVEDGRPPESGRRAIVGAYHPAIKRDLAAAEALGYPVPGAEEILRDKNWRIDEVFTRESRAAIATVLQVSWLAAGAGLMWCLACVMAPRRGGASLGEQRARLNRMTPALPEKVALELSRALDTLEKADNAPDTLTCLSRVFEGPHGLLAAVYQSCDTEVRAQLATKNNAEDKSLRAKLEREGFGRLDLSDQIEVLRLARVLRRMQASDLHWIRVHRNDPGAHGGDLDRRRALIALDFALDLAEWHCRRS